MLVQEQDQWLVDSSMQLSSHARELVMEATRRFDRLEASFLGSAWG